MRPDAVLVGMAFLWATTFIITKDIVFGAPPLAFLSIRFGAAALLMAILCFRRLADSPRTVRAGLVLGALNTGGLVLQVFGQAYTSASKSAFITSLNTPLTPLMALLLYRTRPTPRQLLTVAIASGGLFLLTWPESGMRWNSGDLLTIGCACMYALTICEIARRSPGHDALALSAAQIIGSAVMIALLWLGTRVLLAHMPLARLPEPFFLESRALVFSPRLAWEVAYMSIVCTVITFVGQTWAMSKMSATRAAIIFALEPVFATAIAVTVSGAREWPGARGATGAALVLAAVVASELKLRRDGG